MPITVMALCDWVFMSRAAILLCRAADCQLFSEAMNGLVAHLEELIQNSGRAYYIHKVMIRESAYNGDMMVVFVTQEAAWRLPSWLNN